MLSLEMIARNHMFDVSFQENVHLLYDDVPDDVFDANAEKW